MGRDLFSRRVVGWSTADHLKAELVCEATRRALRQRIGVARQLPGGCDDDAAALIDHSDRGSPYASSEFQQLLEDHGSACSMSRKGDCYDNAVNESFSGTLKTEPDEPLPTRAIAHNKLFDCIEVFYNRPRLHATLNDVSPAA